MKGLCDMRNSNRQWRLKRRPVGEIKTGDLELIDAPKPIPRDGEMLVRNVYLSLDPTNRIWTGLPSATS
jgi:NADPH-dependent curcumin reductase